MKISVIVPNYNGASTILKSIKNIYSQKVDLHQVIVVDDGSTDSSLRLVTSAFPDVEVIPLGSNLGAAKARNAGFLVASGDFLLFVDGDVFLSPQCLKKMLAAAANYDIVYPRVLFEDGTLLSPVSPNEQRFIRRSPSFLIKKRSLSLLDELFDEEYFIYYEDIDFFFRCYLAGLRSYYVESALAFHTIVPQGKHLERRFYLESRNMIYCFLKFNRVPREIKKEFLIPDLFTLYNMMITMLNNKNVYQKYPDHSHNDRLSNSKTRLLMLYGRALLWNIFKLPLCLRKQSAIHGSLRSLVKK